MSNPVGSQSSYPITEAQEQSGRMIKEDGVVINAADILEALNSNVNIVCT